jgi:hypothetical protein
LRVNRNFRSSPPNDGMALRADGGLFQVAKLDDQTADDDQQESQPCGGGNGFLEKVAATQNADDGEEGDVNSEQPGEVPRFRGVDDEAVGAEDGKAGHDKKPAAAAKSPANGGIAADLKQCGEEENKPGKECHARECALRGTTEPRGDGDVNLD